jgi:hypothetical protein
MKAVTAALPVLGTRHRENFLQAAPSGLGTLRAHPNFS